MEYDDIIVGAGSSGAALAARLSEDPDRARLAARGRPRLLSRRTDARRFAEHLGFRRTARLGPGRAGDAHSGNPVPARQGHRRQFCRQRPYRAARHAAAISTNGRRGAITNGASRKSCRSIASSKTIATRAAISTESADRSGSSARAPRPGSRSIALSSTPRARQDTREVWDHNDPESTGIGPWPRNRRDGVRISTAIGYLAPARHRLNLTIRSGVNAHRVIIENGRAVGVEIECAGATPASARPPRHALRRRHTLSRSADALRDRTARRARGARHQMPGELAGRRPQSDRPSDGLRGRDSGGGNSARPAGHQSHRDPLHGGGLRRIQRHADVRVRTVRRESVAGTAARLAGPERRRSCPACSGLARADGFACAAPIPTSRRSSISTISTIPKICAG